jgi:murein DD-endopeptidase MepM/ murein hydrolase activator NlpD
MIQLPSSLETSLIGKSSVSKQFTAISSSSFNEMFSTLLSDMDSISDSSGSNGIGGETLSSLMMIMFNKLFGDNSNIGSTINNTPQGIPVNGVITQTSHKGHVALDYGVPVGTNVKTTMDGKVTYAGWNNEGYGNLVIVENGGYKTYYAHLSSIPVKVGQMVDEGDVIGLSGNTGNSTGPHLHYEIRKNGVAINPLTTING